jgi:hypothetical protein
MRDESRKTFRFIVFGKHILIIGFLVIISACGYRVRSSVGILPSGIKTLGIPTFQNLTTEYKIEQLITGAVLKEFSLRTRTSVSSNSSGVDAVLLGEIRRVSSVPVTFGTQPSGSQTFGSAFQITVQVSVKLMRTSDSAIIWKNEDFLYQERYDLNTHVRDFFSEENPALDRLARNFAASLASLILDRPNL